MDFSKSGKAEPQVCTSGGAGEAEDESDAAGEAELMTVVPGSDESAWRGV